MSVFKTLFLRSFLIDKNHFRFFIVFYFAFPLIFLFSILLGFGSMVSEVVGYSYFGFAISGCLIITSFFLSYIDVYLFQKTKLIYNNENLPISPNSIFYADWLYSSLKSTLFTIAIFIFLLFYQPIPWVGLCVLLIGIFLASSFGYFCAVLLLQKHNDLKTILIIAIFPLFMLSDFLFPTKNLFLNFLAYLNPLYYLNSFVRLAINPNFLTFSTRLEIYGYPLIALTSVILMIIYIKDLVAKKS